MVLNIDRCITCSRFTITYCLHESTTHTDPNSGVVKCTNPRLLARGFMLYNIKASYRWQRIVLFVLRVPPSMILSNLKKTSYQHRSFKNKINSFF